MFAKLALVALAAGAQVSFAAPVQEKRAVKGLIPLLAGGAASFLTGQVLNNKRDESGVMVDTETGILYMEVPDANEGRSLKAIGTAVAGGIASGVAGAVASDIFGKRSLTAIENFFGGLFNKRSEPSGLMVDTETGVIYMEVPDANEGRSLKAIGTAVAGGIASGVAGAVASDIFGKREPASGIMVDTETGLIYADVPDANAGRSLKAIGTAVAGGIASGVAGAVASDIFGKRGAASGLMVDTESGVIYMEVPDANDGRSLKAIGTAVAGGIASGVAGAVASDIFGKRDIMVDTETGIIYADVPDTNEERSLKAIGTAVAGGIASGVAGAVASDIFNKREELSGLMVDTETGTIFMDVPDAVEDRSLQAIGNFFSNLFNKRGEELDARSLQAIGNFFSGLFNKRDEIDARSFQAIGSFFSSLFNKRGEELDARSLSAIENFFGNLFNKRGEEVDARSLHAIGNAIQNFLDENVHIARSGKELDARSLTAIENFFGNLFNKRGEELDERSLTAIKNFVGGLFNKRSVLEESMAKRSINDLE